MKHLFTAILFLCATAIYGQYTLETPDRKKVKLEPNGTWKYLSPNDSSLLTYTGYYRKFSIRYDPRYWIKDTSATYTVDGQWEIAFRSKDAALIGTYIEYRIPLDNKTAEESVRSMYESMGELSNITSKDTTVNGLKLEKVEFQLNYGGYDYMYTLYTYNAATTSFQFLVGGYKHVYYEDKKILVQLLNSVRAVK